MKKFIFIYLMLVTLNVSAKEWEPYWIVALEDYHGGNYISAEHNFNTAINLMENENDLEHPSAYVDRAHLHLLLNKYENALSDTSKALFSGKLNVQERIRATSAKVVARARLGFSDGYEEDMEFLVRNFQIQVKNTENHIVVRNIPTDKAFRQFMTDFFIRAGICNEEKDVKILSPDICIVNKAARFDPSNDEEFYTLESSAIDASKQLRRDPRTIEACRIFCDANTEAAISWCLNFPELCLVSACNSAVSEIQSNCRNCCQNGFSSEICVVPFGDIVAVMQKYLIAPCGCK